MNISINLFQPIKKAALKFSVIIPLLSQWYANKLLQNIFRYKANQYYLFVFLNLIKLKSDFFL